MVATADKNGSVTMRVAALAGGNGTGKTTLIRAIAGDLAPVPGSIRVGGRALAPAPSAAARLGIRVLDGR
jgi:iron complex transport system ATP-binding protein